MSKVLSGHRAAAEKALLHELRRQGVTSGAAAVDVVARPDELLVELEVAPGISPTQAHRIATPVAQAVWRYDRRAHAVEITVHPAPAPSASLGASS
jgi:divalent metal cation (Fe/Co/Zn/Cd) transporter